MAQKKATTKKKYARNKSFASIGNLAFYDGWKPDYVYFSSLLNAGMVFDGSSWNGSAAAEKAASAIGHAQEHMSLKSSEAANNKHFTDRIKNIIGLLEKAVKAERKNELAFFKEKLRKVNASFTPEEKKLIKPIQQLVKVLENGEKVFDYENFITLINVIMMGVDNAKALAEHESKRITAIKSTLDDIIASRGRQAKGLAYAKDKDLQEQERSAERAKERLNQKITVEYIQQGGTLTRRIEESGKYAIFGAGLLEKKIDKPVSDVLAKWASDMLKEIIANPEIITAITAKIQGDYPLKTGNFSHLAAGVRQIIIDSIIHYGLTHLNTVLNEEINSIVVEEVEQFLTNESSKVFDTVAKYNIHGIDTGLGQALYKSTIFDDAQTTVDLLDRDTKNLFEQIKTLLDKEKNLDVPKKTSYLIRAMNNVRTRGKTSLEEAEEIIALIEAVEQVQLHAEDLLDKWRNNKSKKDLVEKMSVSDSNGQTIPFTIVIHEGEIVIENMQEVTNALAMTEGYQDLGFKTFNPQKLKTMVASLKKKAATKLKKSLIDATQKMIRDQTVSLSESELMTMMGRELGGLDINITGPSMETLIPTLQFSQAVTGNIMVDVNQKNKQVVIIEIKYNEIMKTIRDQLKPKLVKNIAAKNKFNQLRKELESAQQEFLYEFQARCNEATAELSKTANSEKKLGKKLETAMVNMSRLGRYDEQLNESRTKITTATRKLSHFLEELGISEDTIDELKHGHVDDSYGEGQDSMHGLLNALKNSFKIVPTIATAETYVDDIGFTSDALGTNLDEQLSSINEIFIAAGMKIPANEMRWLRSAIINCFPGSVVGTKNKHLIENYLGSLAAFALFSEGGVETAIISNFYQKYFSSMKHSMTSPEYIHLYIADGMYVPGSYVLQKTIDTLKTDVLTQIDNIPATIRKGAGIEIINNASESMITTNRPMKNYLKQQNPNAWAATGKAVASQVQLKIVFLAGLLDIANSINEKLSGIQIPLV